MMNVYFMRRQIVKDVIASVIANVLTALYQPFWFALLFSIVSMFVFLFATDKENAGLGVKHSVIIWWKNFRYNKNFRQIFFLVFYTIMILFRTLINRNMWLNPVYDIWGQWWIYSKDPATGELKFTTECIENIILFVPFTYFLFSIDIFRENIRIYNFVDILLKSALVVFSVSLSIEFLQLFLRVGQFQLSDLFYNTIGGIIGGMLFYVTHRKNLKRFRRES